MSEKRSAISVYLTPRTATLLRDYSMGSGYGSISRTVEEIILAFDGVYKNMQSINKISNTMPSDPQKQKAQALVTLVSLLAILQSINTILSRLQPSSPDYQISP